MRKTRMLACLNLVLTEVPVWIKSLPTVALVLKVIGFQIAISISATFYS